MSQMDPMLEVFIYENSQLLEQLEEMFLNAEANKTLSQDDINEVFRIMHTIKGSSSMMSFDQMAKLAHKLEDMFSLIRDKIPTGDIWVEIFDCVLQAVDFFKEQMDNIKSGEEAAGDNSTLLERVGAIYKVLNGEEVSIGGSQGEKAESKSEESKVVVEEIDGAQYYYCHIFFEDGCGMETIRAFGALNNINGMYSAIRHIPENIDDNKDDEISDAGFQLYFQSIEPLEIIRQKLEETLFLKSMDFKVITKEEYTGEDEKPKEESEKPKEEVKEVAKAEVKKAQSSSAPAKANAQQSFISVNVDKIDKLMNLMGEIVTTESMVIKNPDIANLKLENFDKQARLLRKLTDELQDVVMSVRMVPISAAFHKMKRIVRDMSKKIDKEVELVLIGEKTEVDKNVMDSLSDPLMHLIRNSMDHGIETKEERAKTDKSPVGRVTLEAKNTGGDIIVTVKDDGRGLDAKKLIEKAINNGLTNKSPDEISDKEAYQFILKAGFSTKKQVTEFSGRGVGMDVVKQNIENIGGTISIESELGKGSSMIMHIPLTLAIIEGMNVKVGNSKIIIPILNIWESLEGRTQEIIQDPHGNDMVMIRGKCFKIIKLYEQFGIDTDAKEIKDGILVLVKSEKGDACLLVDSLLGEQQAVIKPIPGYILKILGKLKGVGGCSILGDGNISLIIDLNSLLDS